MARDSEVVCLCAAYDHPHRLGGGKCTGSAWCTAYRAIDNFECEHCNLNTGGQCEVVLGVEKVEHAPCVREELITQNLREEYGHLPLDVEDYWAKKQKEYYDHGDDDQ